jgi:hypothetical protein
MTRQPIFLSSEQKEFAAVRLVLRDFLLGDPLLRHHALARQYRHADRQWGWQWVFPQRKCWKDADTAKDGHLLSDIIASLKGPVRKTFLFRFD